MKYRLAVLILVVLALLAGCRVVEALPAPSPVTQIGQAQAVTAAEDACAGGFLQPLEKPRLLQARLMTRGQAEAVQAGHGSLLDPPTPQPGDDGRMAWLLALEGRWQHMGGPASTTPPGSSVPTTAPVILTRCQVVVDAASGAIGSITN